MTVVFMFASQFAGKIGSPALSGVLGFFLWLAKFLGCIFLMRWFMSRLVAKYEGVIGADTFRLGVWIALFSALILSAFTLVNMLYISPDAVSESFDQIFAQMGPMLDSNSQEVRNNIIDSIVICHDFIREKYDKSSVSMREIRRFGIFLEYFIKNL
ncbi:MAG: DUF4199 family protein, partial [Bacteroidales bacterium]|nr:DUF4199 family protein [Bacteroidales bacterium]